MAALVAFAKAADLQVLCPQLTDDEATMLLDVVSGAIRSSVGWDVDSVSGLTHTEHVPFSRQAFPPQGVAGYAWAPTRTNVGVIRSVILPSMRVTSVESVVVDGATLATGNYYVSPTGVVDLAYPAFADVTVTYTAGYVRAPVDQVPGAFRSVCLEQAVLLAENPTGGRGYALGAFSETFGTEAQARRDLDSETRLDPYRVNL